MAKIKPHKLDFEEVERFFYKFPGKLLSRATGLREARQTIPRYQTYQLSHAGLNAANREGRQVGLPVPIVSETAFVTTSDITHRIKSLVLICSG
jgi:hypothetical protein